MARLSLRLLGDFEARLGSGPPLRLRARKTQALLAYLASSPGQTHSRDKLASLLWGDSSQSQARSRLRGSLFVLRRTLASADPPCLVLDGDAVALNVDVYVDVVVFRRLVVVHDPDALANAVELYRGDLLEGFAFRGALFEEWLIAERERLRELAVDGLAKLLVHQRSSGVLEAAVQTGLRLVALDPLQESVHRTLMRLYAELGRRPAGLRQYQMCVRVLQRELGVEPDAETKRLYRELVRWQPHSARAQGHTRPHNQHDAEQPLRDVLSKDAPLIGRDAERTQLRHVLEDAAQGHGHVVTLVGEAGIGKTSVLSAVAGDAIALGARVLVGRCYESASILAFGPWVDAFRSGRTLDNEMLDELHPVWRSEIARLLPEANTANLPAPSDNPLGLFEGVAHLVERLAARRALILMLEDIHWADEMSLRLLAFISRRTPRWRVLILTTAREHELLDASMARRTIEELRREVHAVSLELAPLSRLHTASLVRSLSRVGTDAAALARLEEQVWAVSEGNPFVAVETMRAVHEGSTIDGSTALALAKRVRDLITDRLTRLSDRGRQLAAVAAVIGREFEFALLQRASGSDEAAAAEGLEELVRRGVVEGADDRFDFTHDRIRAVINAELLLPQRKLLHRQIGTALEALHADDLDTHSAALGTHYRAAEVWDKAVRYLWQAGRQAAARSALPDARVWFEQALDALEPLPESAATLERGFEVRMDLAMVLNSLGEPLLARVREAEMLAEKLNDDRRRGLALARMSVTHANAGELDEALATGARAVEIAGSLGDLRLRIRTTSVLALAYLALGEYEHVVTLASDDIAALPDEWTYQRLGGSTPPSIFDRYLLVQSLAALGRFAEATEYETEMLRLAERIHDAHPIGLAHQAASLLHTTKGDWARARPLIEHWIEVARAGNLVVLYRAVALSAHVLAQLGEVRGAVGRLMEGMGLVDRIPAQERLHMASAYRSLGHACVMLGRLDDARRFGDRALAFSPNTSAAAAQALHLLGDIATHPERFDPERGEVHYREALTVAQRRGMRPLVAHCHLGLGKLYSRTGKRPQAQDHLATATSMYRETAMTYWLAKAEREMQAST